MAKKVKEKELSTVERLQEMHAKGTEVMLPGTDRIIRLRTLDAPTLLAEGKMPDTLTPLLIKSIYQDLSDREVRDFLGQQRGNVNEALEHVKLLDFVAEKAIADGTKVKDLTIGEKRMIFRFVVGPAELLIPFRYDPNSDVADVDESEILPQDAE